LSTALAGASLPAVEADAGIFLTGYDDAQHLAIGSEYLGQTLHLNFTRGSFTNDSSAVRLNENWAITAAHVVGGSSGVANPEELTLTNSLNYLTDIGDSFSVEEIIFHPLNDFSGPTRLRAGASPAVLWPRSLGTPVSCSRA
jgi:hypothetical protein